MSQVKAAFIFSEDKRAQFQKALNQSHLSNIIKIVEQRPLEIKVSLDSKFIPKLFALGIEFERVGKQKETADKVKPWCCDKCWGRKKPVKHKYIKNYCDTCWESVSLLYFLERFWQRRKELYFRKIKNPSREPPVINMPEMETAKPQTIKAPIIKFKFST